MNNANFSTPMTLHAQLLSTKVWIFTGCLLDFYTALRAILDFLAIRAVMLRIRRLIAETHNSRRQWLNHRRRHLLALGLWRAMDHNNVQRLTAKCVRTSLGLWRAL